jgi:hypothetical protein
MHVETEMRVQRNPSLHIEDEEPRAAIMYRGRGGADEPLGTRLLWGVSMRTNPCVKSVQVLMPGGIDDGSKVSRRWSPRHMNGRSATG